MVYPITKWIFGLVFKLFIKRIDGLENLPNKPFILVSNHESYIDGLLCTWLIAWYKNKRLSCVITHEIFTGGFWDAVFSHYGGVRVNGSVEKLVKSYKKGNCIGIFPEGERAHNHKIKSKITHTGIGALALLTKAPVVPVGISTYNFWNRYSKLPTFKRNIIVTIGKPMKFKGKPTKQNIRKTMDSLWKEVKKLARISHT